MTLLRKISGGNTHGRDNPIHKLVVNEKATRTVTEFDIAYEVWAGQLHIPMHLYIDKDGIKVKNNHGEEITLSWEEVEDFRNRLG